MNLSSTLSKAITGNTLIINQVGICYLISPSTAYVMGLDRNFAVDTYKNKLQAHLLLKSHSNRWGVHFNISKLYNTLSRTPLKNILSEDEKHEDLCCRIASGELIVYQIKNFNLPSSEPYFV